MNFNLYLICKSLRSPSKRTLSPLLSHCLRGQIFVLELFNCKRGYLIKSGCENLHFIYKATVIDKEKEN